MEECCNTNSTPCCLQWPAQRGLWEYPGQPVNFDPDWSFSSSSPHTNSSPLLILPAPPVPLSPLPLRLPSLSLRILPSLLPSLLNIPLVPSTSMPRISKLQTLLTLSRKRFRQRGERWRICVASLREEKHPSEIGLRITTFTTFTSCGNIGIFLSLFNLRLHISKLSLRSGVDEGSQSSRLM